MQFLKTPLRTIFIQKAILLVRPHKGYKGFASELDESLTSSINVTVLHISTYEIDLITHNMTT